MIAFFYFLVFFVLWYFYKRKHKKSVGSLLLFIYVISGLLSLVEYYKGPINSPDLDLLPTLYYIACVIISLIPFLLLGKYDCRKFQISDKLLTYLSYVLIVFGVIQFVKSSIELTTNINVLLYNMQDLRFQYYDTMLDSKQITAFDKLSIIVTKMQYMSPFCCFYFMSKGNKKMAGWLFFASLGEPIGQMTIGERQCILRYISNIIFCYYFFAPALSKQIKAKIKRIGSIAIFPLILFVVAMTIARFATREGGILSSLFLYGGDQPFFFSSLMNNKGLDSQLQWGRVNFQYFFPASERVQGQINLFINSDLYLNQFGGLPGSLYLDFGYYTIFIILLASTVYSLIIYNVRLYYVKYPFYLLFLFYFSYQVLFMNVFYYYYSDLFKILFTTAFFIISYLYTNHSKTHKRYKEI